MASERVGDMTREELRNFINRVIEEKEATEKSGGISSRSPQEVFQSIRRNRLKRRPNQPSVSEMLREDRDR
jgi:hypothetical protein